MIQQKLMAAVCAAALALTGCAPAPTQPMEVFSPDQTVGQSQQQPVSRLEELRIPCDLTQGTTPWQTTDQNTRQASNLVFDSLVRLSPAYQPQLSLAQEISTQDNQTFRITLRAGVVFSDNTPLTPQLVEQSLVQAMAEGSRYQQSLSAISSHRITEDGVLEIVLISPDQDFPNLLTFPVAKQGEQGYLGTGRYRYLAREGQQLVLERNPSHWGEPSSIPRIRLVQLPSQEIAPYSLRIGEIDCLYSDLSGEELNALSTSSAPVELNHLVFLGVNCRRGAMQQVELRQALSAALDRQALVQTVYSAKAAPAYTPFLPTYYRLEGIAGLAEDPDQAAALLAQAGEEGLTLSLLYHSGSGVKTNLAQQLAAQLGERGITLTLEGRSYTDYLAALRAGGYDLYLGELEIPDNMDLSHLLQQGEGYGYGAAPSQALTQSYSGLRAGTVPVQDFVTAFVAELPAIPLLYRQGVAAFSRELALEVQATKQDLFYNIHQWQ